jgi:hypothetical protein
MTVVAASILLVLNSSPFPQAAYESAVRACEAPAGQNHGALVASM